MYDLGRIAYALALGLAAAVGLGRGVIADSAEAARWKYFDGPDPMGRQRVSAIVTSNITTFDWSSPRTGTAILGFDVREGRLSAAIMVKGAELLCEAHGKQPIAIRFDDGPVFDVSCSKESSGIPWVLFLKPAAVLLAEVEAATTVTIAVTLVRDGRHYFVFPVAGLRRNLVDHRLNRGGSVPPPQQQPLARPSVGDLHS